MRDHERTRLRSPRFASFLVVQFLGAANDNAFKITLTLVILAKVSEETTQLRLSSLATFLFPLPFLLFAPMAGYFADRFRKSRVLPIAKMPEVLAMALAIVALHTENITFMMAVLFIMATQSAFFSPPKYGLLPESVEAEQLSMANGILQMTTNLAILVGSAMGVLVYSSFKNDLARAGWVYLALAVVGTLSAFYVPRTPPGNRRTGFEWNVVSASRAAWGEARRLPVLSRTLLGIAYFGFLGSVFLTVIPVYGRNVLGMSEEKAGLMLMILSIGIGVGSVIAGRLSKGHVELGLVPLGSLGLAVFAMDLALFGAGGRELTPGMPVRTVIDLSLMGIAAGFYIVPLNSLLQLRSPDGMKGRMIAFSNVLTFTAVILASVVTYALTNLLGLGVEQVVLAMAVVTALASLYIVNLLPDFLVRLVLWVLTSTVYRIRAIGTANIPNGGGLFVANHVSWVDSFLVGSACSRMIRFLMYRPYYETPALNWFFRRMHVIPVAAGDPPELKDASLAKAREQIEQGHIVCIFAEGSITRTGNLLRFRRGFETIARGSDAPITPVLLDGVWGSLFSFEKGTFLFKFPKQLSWPVTVVFGKPMAPTAQAHEVRQKIQELSVEAFRLRKDRQRPIQVEFLRTARRFWRRSFLTDSHGRSLTFGETLVRSLALGSEIFGTDRGQPGRVGILLAHGIPAALANLATLGAGKTVVNLDTRLGADVLRQEIGQADLERLVTSREIFDALPVDTSDLEVVFVEDAERSVESRSLLRLRATARLLPASLASRWLLDGDTRNVNLVAAISFSFAPLLGGVPRGAVLSHHNILSNMESLKQVFRVSREDRILGVHSFSTPFGLMGTLFLPAVVGVPVVYHDDPSDTATLIRLASEHRLSMLPVTPDLLDLYSREIPPEAFADLRHAVVAGEALDDAVRQRFIARYGVEPLEGFGCVECAPLVSLNVPSIVRGSRQVSRRPGTAGHPLPGIAVKVVDTETGEMLPPDREGALFVRGPNVMLGYHGDPDATARVLRDGWYRTGYTATQDPDGFLTITGPEQP
jgi:acyl-[acyl-carrier-protein]-phospholipid O-acyltransferase/long-chain-fatty-acid--[acyl-carrier-protein] ligase